jgi:hypothetical protein
MNKLFVCFFYLFIIFTATNSYSQTANPTRPSAADNGYLTEYGYSEIEFGYAGNANEYNFPVLLKFSVLKKLEAGVVLNGLVTNNGSNTQIGNPGFQLKFQPINSDVIAATLVGRMTFDDSSSPVYTIYTAPSLQTNFAEIDLTAGSSLVNSSSKYEGQFFYAVAISPKIEMPIGIFGEIFGENSSGANSVYTDFGIGYSVSSSFVLDTAFVIGLNESSTDWIFQIGLTKTLFKFL